MLFRNASKIFVFNTLLAFVLLIIIEIICRGILFFAYNRNFDSKLIQDNKYAISTGLFPNASGKVWGEPFKTDRFGFRSTGRKFNKQKKTRLFIGDSVTQGVGVEDSADFVSVIARKEEKTNVLNCSMIGWSFADYSNALSGVLSDSIMRGTVADVTICWCLNDIYGNTPAGNLPEIGGSGFLNKLSDVLHTRYATYKLFKLISTQNSSHYYKYDTYLYTDETMVKDAVGGIELMKQVCESNGIAFRVVLLPYRSNLKCERANKAFGEFTTKVDSLLGINCINLTCREDLADIRPKEFYLFSDEIHLSEKGHQWVAGEISKIWQ